MRVTEKVQKTNATHTAKAHKTQIKALDKCISYNDKLRLMVLEVLREESGRELASVARFNGGEFDWETHNAQFRADYSETPLKELMRASRILYGLTDMDAIRAVPSIGAFAINDSPVRAAQLLPARKVCMKKWMLLTTTSMIWIEPLEQLRISKIAC